MTLTLATLTEFLASVGIPCEIDGDEAATVSSVATLEEAGEGQISFLSNPKYEKDLATTRATAVLVKPEVNPGRKMNLLRTADPYAALTASIVAVRATSTSPLSMAERALRT